MKAIETGQPHYVLDFPKSTNTQSKFIKNTLITKVMETSPSSTKTNCPTLSSYAGAFRASLFPSPEREEVSTILEELCSFTSPESSKLKDLAYYSLKTSKGYSLTMKGGLLPQSSPRLMSWGMTSNGKCLTARISESPRIGKECSLSDILEEQVDQKYFLSQEQIKSITKQLGKGLQIHSQGEMPVTETTEAI